MSAPTFHAGVSRSFGVWLLGFLALMVALISVGGWLQFNNQKVETRRLAVERLDYIAALKSEQIAQWMHERRADAITRIDQSLARRFLQAPHDAVVRQELQQWMSRVQKAYGYSAVVLFDAAGTLRLQATNSETRWQDAVTVARIREYARDTMSARDVVFFDLHRLPDQSALIAFAVPVGLLPQAEPSAAGALLFIIDPQDFLFPALQRWPVSAMSCRGRSAWSNAGGSNRPSPRGRRVSAALLLARAACGAGLNDANTSRHTPAGRRGTRPGGVRRRCSRWR